ncbi:MAG: hypothetical protein IPH18_13665 [Chitinophagaceae bacterium]|nr:hypothetical protein [Chitinophagaceae bacterium]MBK8952343.1 hypothetical protein [Chitinophagaceae bacterium]
MRYRILAICLILTVALQAIAQQTKPAVNDSLLLPSDTNSFSKTADTGYTIIPAPVFDSNIDALIVLQKENNRKQRRAAIIRIALGLGFLVVLVVGLLRRRKKQ